MLAVGVISLFGTLYAQSASPKASLNHIAVYVVDLQVSTDFYHEVIGLDSVPEPFHDGRHTWFAVGPNIKLHLISGAATKEFHDKNAHLCFTVPSVDAFIKNLKSRDIPFESWEGKSGSYTRRVDGVKQIYFKDPDGYWIEINDARE